MVTSLFNISWLRAAFLCLTCTFTLCSQWLISILIVHFALFLFELSKITEHKSYKILYIMMMISFWLLYFSQFTVIGILIVGPFV